MFDICSMGSKKCLIHFQLFPFFGFYFYLSVDSLWGYGPMEGPSLPQLAGGALLSRLASQVCIICMRNLITPGFLIAYAPLPLFVICPLVGLVHEFLMPEHFSARECEDFCQSSSIPQEHAET